MQILPEAGERLQAIFQAFPDPLFVLERDGTILDYKSGDPAPLIQPPERLLGRRIQDVFPPEVASKFDGALKHLHTRQIVTLDYSLALHGRPVWFEARIALVSPGRAAIFIRDITDRKQSELSVRKQLERMAALRAIDIAIASSQDLGATLSVLVHQVRTQLQVDAASILLMDPESNALQYASGDGFHTPGMEHAALKAGVGVARQATWTAGYAPVPALGQRDPSFLRSPQFAREGFVDYLAIPLIAKMRMLGVLEIFHRSPILPEPDWLDFMNMLAGQAAIAIDSAVAFRDIERTNSALTMAYDATIEGWSKALELRDRETHGHAERVSRMVSRLAAMLGIGHEQVVQIRRGAALHDIGKMAIPDHILFKAGPLDSSEWEVMRQHPSIALELLRPIKYLTEALDIPQYHHEKWNGTGYPHGLREEQIPLSARLFAAVDVYDALTSNRPYRTAWSHEDALGYIKSQSGKHFDPRVIEAFSQMMDKQEPGEPGL